MEELELVCEGRSYKVSMTASVAKAFKKVDAKERARIIKWMNRFADDGAEFLDAEKLKHEGKYPLGNRAGTEVAIFAFKAWQVRVCGGARRGQPLHCNRNRRQQKADKG